MIPRSIAPDWRPRPIDTDRLVLRAFEEADAEPLFEHARNPNVARFTLWDAHRTVADARLFVRDYARCRYLEGVPEPYAITRKADPDRRPVGSVGCFWAAQPHFTMELGYWVAEPFWGQGVVAEACRRLIPYVFAEYPVHRLQARVIAGNTASVRVLEKLGFRPEGTHRASLWRRGKFEDVMYFARLKTDGPL